MEGLPAPDAIITPDGHNWAVKASRAACTSCHEDAVQHTEEYGKYTCEACHSDNKVKSVREVHRNLIEETAARFEPRILSVSNTAPGQFPEVRFSIVDPTNGNQPYDLKTDPAWTVGGGASRLAIDLAWSTTELHRSATASTWRSRRSRYPTAASRRTLRRPAAAAWR